MRLIISQSLFSDRGWREVCNYTYSKYSRPSIVDAEYEASWVAVEWISYTNLLNRPLDIHASHILYLGIDPQVNLNRQQTESSYTLVCIDRH